MSDQSDDFSMTPPYAAPGDRIGPYKLLQRLGDGGMGTVWQAEQTEPVRRTVAVKLILPGLDSKEVLARFEVERRALGLMDHPNIAKVLDAGTTPAGRPYFVMELVKGVPLTKYCDDARLTLRQRLELFVSICQAVQHAHQKGIIHRDLKPTNVLVALSDDKPVPKVIDFGVAKALHGPLTEKTLVTELGFMLGTPEYAAPEQADLTALDIDTRADIYALGAILYDLLTGARPFDGWDLRRVRTEEYLRIIREVEPPTPSKRLSSADTLAETAARRGTDAKQLSKLVRGELDWIVMKCLEKERSRRYETANALALDVERHLRDEPVLAGPPSKAYRLRKFVQRNKGPVLAAAAMALLLVGGIVGTSWGMVNAQRAREQALRSLGQLEKGNEILGAVFSDLDPQSEEMGGDSLQVHLGKRLARAAAQLEGETVGDRVVVARLQNILGHSLYGLGHYDEAQSILEKAQETLTTFLGADDPQTLNSKGILGSLHFSQREYAKAERLLNDVLQALMARPEANDDEILRTKNKLAALYQHKGQYAQAESLYQEVLKRETVRPNADHSHILATKNNLATLYLAQRQYTRAESLMRDVLNARTAKLEHDHADVLLSKYNLARLYYDQRQYAKAKPLLQEAARGFMRKLGSTHVHTLNSKFTLAMLYHYQEQQYTEAETLYQEVLEARKVKLGSDDPETLTSLHALAVHYKDRGQLAKAEPLLQEVTRVRTTRLGRDDPDTLHSQNSLAVLYVLQGQYTRAEPLLREVVEHSRRRLGIQDPVTQNYVRNLATCYEMVGQPAKASPLFRELAEYWRQQAGPNSAEYARELSSLGNNLLLQNNSAEAEPALRDALVAREKNQPSAWTTFNTRSLLGGALLLQRKYADAEPLLVQGYEGMKKHEAMIPKNAEARLTEAAERLVKLYDEWGKPDEAAKWRKELEALPKPEPKPANPPAKRSDEKKP